MNRGRWMFPCGLAVGLAAGWLVHPPFADPPAKAAASLSGAAPRTRERVEPATASSVRRRSDGAARTLQAGASAGSREQLFPKLLSEHLQFANPLELARQLAELTTLDREEAIGLLTILNELPDEDRPDGEMGNLLVGTLLARLSQLDGPAAMRLLVDPRFEGLLDFDSETYAAMTMNAWMAADPDGARRWFGERVGEAEESVRSLGEDVEFEGVLGLLECDEFRLAYMRGLAEHDPDGLAREIAAVSHPDARDQLLDDQALARVQLESTAEGLLALLPDLRDHGDALDEAIEKLSLTDPRAAMDWIGSQPADSGRDACVRGVAQTLMERDPDSAIEWYLAQELVEPEARQRRLADVASRLMDTDPRRASEWLAQQPDDRLRDGAEGEMAQALARRGDWAGAFTWIAGIEDGTTRGETLQMMRWIGRIGRPMSGSEDALDAAEAAGFGEAFRIDPDGIDPLPGPIR